jgi:biopolymer transport protein ExbD
MRGRKGMKRYMERRLPSTFKIQITSMVDMFVILLVFLLKSYSTSPVNIPPSDKLTLPVSTSTKDPVDVLKLVVNKDGIFVDEKQILKFDEKGEVAVTDLDANDTNFIRSLYTELDQQATKSRDIAKVNETLEFDGKVLMQADRGMPYALLRKVMYTSMLAGYSDVKIAVMMKE